MENTGSIAEYVSAFKNSPVLGRQLVFHHIEKARNAAARDPAQPLRPETIHFLRSSGIPCLYLHQAEAIDAVRQGRNVVVATSTASGKTLAYNIPVLEKIIEKPSSRSLYLFPLKALANDQIASFSAMAHAACPDRKIACAVYDGDTSPWNRKKIRNAPPNIIFTNPDMLHLSILPYHTMWAEFLENLEFIVVDEVHTYRGLFGSHMAWVFRRLRRICTRYGSDPVFIFCSATVGNPGELASGLTGLDVMPVTESGAPSGVRHFIMADPEDGGAAQMAVQLLVAALHRGLRTIVYTQSRKLTELINLWTTQRAKKFADRITAYRAGFLPEERRKIESRMSRGSLLAVISTSALELGIDIGALDLCILVGYPGTVMSTWQRGGRVGRSMRESAVILIAQEDALDRYFLQHPQDLITRPAESAVINPFNSAICKKHLVCAAAELPVRTGEEIMLPGPVKQTAAKLEKEGKLLRSADGVELFSGRRYPHREVSLRGTGRSFQIISSDTGKVIGSVDGFRAMRETHPGAVYLHRGKTYLIKSLDIEGLTALASPANLNYFTRVTATKDTKILKIIREYKVGSTRFFFGTLRVTDQVTGYERRMVRGQRLTGRVPLDLPPQVFETEGFWFIIPDEIKKTVEKHRMHFMGGIHALEHGTIGILPLFVLSDRNDLGGISFTWHPQCESAAVFIYDGVPGGIGLSREAFRRARDVMMQVIKTIKSCPCENGCPSCVHSPKCGSGNRPIDKEAAIFTAEALLGEKTGRNQICGNTVAKTQADKCSSEFTGVNSSLPPVREMEKDGTACALRNREGGRGAGAVFRLPDNFAVFDIETQLSAAEAGGWGQAHRMKVSCAVLFSSVDQAFHTFFEHDLDSFFTMLKSVELIAGFNVNRFDYRVLSAYTDMNLWNFPTIDLLEKIYERLGYRISLNGLASVTLGCRKSADGLMALKWWKQGKLEKIAEYCRMDVKITRDLLLFAAQNGYLLFRNRAGKTVRVPLKLP